MKSDEENCRCETDVKLKNDEFSPKEPKHFGDGCNALKNYGTWLQKRNEIHHKMRKKIERGSGDLLMNLSDELREIKEEKEAIEYTNIPQKFDKYRGNPARWQLPPGLHDKCIPNELKYLYQKTKVQKNEIPEIDRIGLPTYIKCEKMLLPRVREVNDKWKNSEYRKERFQQLSSLLENIIPHKPNFEELIIVGNQIQQPEEKLEEIPIIIENLDFSKDTEIVDATEKTPKYCLIINDKEFNENSKNHKFHVNFEYDLENTELQTRCIKFENIGRVTLRISFNRVKKFQLFRDIIKSLRIETFCFDKNELILIPGQIVEFPIWFRSKKLCYIVEIWEIITLPAFFPKESSILFEIQAITHIDQLMKKITKIKNTMEQRVKKRIIKDLLDDALHKTKYENYKSINYSYYEFELFEASNLDDDDPERKPKYLYNKAIVEQLKELYGNSRQIYHPKMWNLNVSDLQVITRLKDLVEYAEELTREFSQCRKKPSKTLIREPSDKKMKRNSMEVKSRVKINMEENLENGEKKETYYGTLMKLLSQLSPPCMKWNYERVKHFQIYVILRTYFTQMSVELSYIKPFITKSKTFVYHERQCERLIFEKFDELQTIRIKKSLYYDDKSHPKPHILRNVASDNIETIHKLYFNKPSTVNLAKNDTKNDKKKDKTPELKKRNSSNPKLQNDDLVIPDFDPYAEDVLINESGTNVISENVKVKKSAKISACDALKSTECLNLYVTIYANLTKAVETVVDTLESVKIFKIPRNDLEPLLSSFKFFVKDNVLGKTSLPINTFEDYEDRQYYETMLKSHLNEITTKYLICNETEDVIVKHKEKSEATHPSIDIETTENLELEESPSIFTIPKVEIEEISYKEREAQTVPICPQDVLEIIPEEEEELCLCPPEFREIPSEVSELFYYSDDEKFEELEIVESATESSESLPAKQKESEKLAGKKSNLSRNKILSDISQKKCMLEEPVEKNE